MPLSAMRAFHQSSASAPELPRIKAFQDLYEHPDILWRPRQGGLIMICGIPGAQKSGFAMFWTAMMNLPTLYFAADTSPFDASMRLASMGLRESTEEIEERLRNGEGQVVENALRGSKIQWSFGAPITWNAVDEELDAYVELHNEYPKIVVIDNAMDWLGCESDYQAQMALFGDLTAFARRTGITTVVLHHATDKGFNDPTMPPPRNAIKNGLAEKPEQVLTLGLDPNTLKLRVALVKNRSGKQDPTGETYATLQAIPEITSFARLGN